MPGFGITLPARSLALIVGETVLLFALCMGIVNFATLVGLWVAGSSSSFSLPWSHMIVRSGIIVVLCQVAYSFQDLYNWRVTSNRNSTSIRLMQSVFSAGVLVALTYYLLNVAAALYDSPAVLAYVSSPWTTVAALVAIFPLSYYYRVMFHLLFRRWRLNDRVLLLGGGEIAKTIENEIKRLQDPGYEIVGYVSKTENKESELEAPHLGPIDDVRDIALRHRVNRLVVALSERRQRLPLIELLNCRLAGVRVEEAEHLYERLTAKIPVHPLRPSYLIFSEGFQRSRTQFAIKRLMDVVLAAIGLVLTVPLGILVAILIKLDSKGPVLFAQKRVGRAGRIFTLYKFRSMHTDAEAGGPRWAAEDDDRVTRIGRIIRLTRIDEIPQMWNVLKNEMSFVGPRPERPFFVDELRKHIPYYMERLLVKPGITGWAQINYRYGSTVTDSLTKLQYDLYYIKHLSIFLDVMILVSTVKVILLRRGAV